MMVRPPPELGQTVAGFAVAWAVGINEAYKNLATLAAVGLGVRHYDLLNQTAVVMPRRSVFVRVALHVNAALLAAGRVAPQSASDPDRMTFLLSTVTDQVRPSGQTIRPEVVESLLARLGHRAVPAQAPAVRCRVDTRVDAGQPSEPEKVPIRITK